MSLARRQPWKVAAIGLICGCSFNFVAQSHAIEFSQTKKLTANDAAATDQFGRAVAVYGETAIIGADRENSVAGSAYIFRKDGPSDWNQAFKLTATSQTPRNFFGQSVSLDGDLALVGASGAAYLFRQDESGDWDQIAELTVSEAGVSANFGLSVSISGGLALVGAPSAFHAGVRTGAAYLFAENELGAWTQVKKITASDGGGFDLFGHSLALEGNLAIIGAHSNNSNAGSAYLFRNDGAGNWNELTNLIASDAAANDQFGISVALSGNTVVVGASFDDDEGNASGSAYIFRENGAGAWSQIDKLTAGEDGSAGDNFGNSVSLHDNTVVVGAWFNDDSGSNSGSAYVFRENASEDWQQIDKLVAENDAAAGDEFGNSVSIHGNAVFVGGWHNADAGNWTGSAYVFERSSSILVGDYNNDGKVTAADYTMWRDHKGGETLTNRDPENSGPVGIDDYNSWLENFGQSSTAMASFTAIAIPEPASWFLAMVGLIGAPRALGKRLCSSA